MTELNDLTPKRAAVLVASQSVADAELVGKLLQDEFHNVRLSTKPDFAVEDFEQHRPSVLVLAFDTLEAAQRYYIGLYRLSTVVHETRHRVVVLCNKHDVWTVYDLCSLGHFDDYVLFWPATNDAPRIRMSVHQALRIMTAQEQAGDVTPRAAPIGVSAPKPPHPAPAETAPDAAAAEAAARAAKPAPGVPQAQPAAAQTAPGVAPQRLAVLIVEDDGFQQKLIGRLMNGLDIDVLFADTGARALEQMWEHKPDLVLMDVGLPDTNGVEATRKIKSIGQFGHVPILMVTGHSERNIVVESLKAGAADFLVKPFDKNTLHEKLRQFLPALATS
ncbi:response regulator [Trinickia dinghuensis]|uniref:Response regulator n=1 Tax=Trinickia dinghuensis TaxID=2291023 RepID=A0A3D8JTZ8_9BURK|nr:response regulator [Trinickia dinghuensis]RDU96573.1 response regulator [Trinickia dinghuensis]